MEKIAKGSTLVTWLVYIYWLQISVCKKQTGKVAMPSLNPFYKELSQV